MKTPELTIYRRTLPHWRMPGAVYFVTWRLAKNQPLLEPEERTIVLDVIKHFDKQRYELAAHVVMDDHVHVLALPFEGIAVHRIVHSWKSYSAKLLTEKGERTSPVWQREYFDRIVRDDEELMQKARYILHNPLKRWADLEEYPWTGLGEGFWEPRKTE